MAAFITDLMQSIFTPGPTPTLLVATNISFACLQVVLLLLLIATYSIHFIILSFLSAGLWWAINWFAMELRAAEEAEAEKKRRLADTGLGSDSETEVETVMDTGDTGVGSKGVEVLEGRGELKDRANLGGSRSELSTEDEWERVKGGKKAMERSDYLYPGFANS
ncbi:V-type ATPase assembly factor [Lachnellula occidentalis]|uniref:V-type ATPase assembly factor n=1 Tax=Lachnellula occidentalis TaxID=215460 RepID=A0A8H8S6I5_9HELO|nr:V-type ATPase assembly factor [Lachnellula occidentalis]